MITHLELTHFKGHHHSAVSLGPFTVLVGPNGSGKSSVLQALQNIGALLSERPTDPVEELRKAQSEGACSVEVRGEHQGIPFQLNWDLLQPQSLTWRFEQGEEQSNIGDQKEQITKFPWGAHLQSAVLFKLQPTAIAAPASSRRRLPQVEFDGQNTAVALKAMKLGYDEEWSRLRDLLRRVIPTLKNLGVEQVELPPGENWPPKVSSRKDSSGEWYQIVCDFEGARHIPASQVSEGTLITIALLAILLGPSRPSLILLDDIEQALHPRAQMELIHQLKELLATGQFNDVQLVATTHSPFVLDGLDFEQVQVFAHRPDGSIAIKSLAQHPDAARLRGVMSAGELWTQDPEASWVSSP